KQKHPRVTSDPVGAFVVAWESTGSFGGDNFDGSAVSYSVQGQLYSPDGSPFGGQFQVNTYGTNAQTWPAVASDPLGRQFVVVWQSNGSAGSDSSFFSVQGQRYVPEPSLAPSLGAMVALLAGLAGWRRARVN